MQISASQNWYKRSNLSVVVVVVVVAFVALQLDWANQYIDAASEKVVQRFQVDKDVLLFSFFNRIKLYR